jgi:uncharacterized membrane protein YccC
MRSWNIRSGFVTFLGLGLVLLAACEKRIPPPTEEGRQCVYREQANLSQCKAKARSRFQECLQQQRAAAEQPYQEARADHERQVASARRDLQRDTAAWQARKRQADACERESRRIRDRAALDPLGTPRAPDCPAVGMPPDPDYYLPRYAPDRSDFIDEDLCKDQQSSSEDTCDEMYDIAYRQCGGRIE